MFRVASWSHLVAIAFSKNGAHNPVKAAWNFSRGTHRVLTLEGAAILPYGFSSAGPKARRKLQPSEWVWGPQSFLRSKSNRRQTFGALATQQKNHRSQLHQPRLHQNMIAPSEVPAAGPCHQGFRILQNLRLGLSRSIPTPWNPNRTLA